MFVFFFSNFIHKSICCGYSSELYQQVDAIQMGTHNICLHKEVDKKYTGYNLKNMVCAAIRSNCCFSHSSRSGTFFLLKSRGIVKEEYLVIILGYLFLFLHKNICCGYSLEVPC